MRSRKMMSSQKVDISFLKCLSIRDKHGFLQMLLNQSWEDNVVQLGTTWDETKDYTNLRKKNREMKASLENEAEKVQRQRALHHERSRPSRTVDYRHGRGPYHDHHERYERHYSSGHRYHREHVESPRHHSDPRLQLGKLETVSPRHDDPSELVPLRSWSKERFPIV